MPFPLTLIEHFAIPHRSMARSPERLELLFNRDTFSFWKKLFVSLLHVVITTLSGLKPEQSGSEKDVTQAHLALRFLRIFLSFGPARIILETPSLKNVLLKRIRSPQGDKWQYKNAPEQFPAKIILHAWKNVVAHDSAVSSLAAINCTVSMVLREYSPTMHVIHAFPPSDSKTMDSIPDIMRTKVIPALRLDKYNFSNSAIIDMLNALILQNLATPDFGGAVHCEATIMGIAYACSHGKYAKNELPFRTGHGTAFHNAFEGHSNTIGFSDKSCQICHWLSEELLLSNGYFHLRGCHGRTLPWSPPRLGIPLSVLQNLELVLLELLTDSTERWLKEEIRRTEGSRME
ncbi:hypothetical protein B0H10DRAFT_1051874 [Mycena sp. CBHHK59/15]|nr:hypothetical protein B0H10DRAFT_1051874 [Mycena sp. CBHHK59/15]